MQNTHSTRTADRKAAIFVAPKELRLDFNFHEYAKCWPHSGGKGTYAEYSNYGQTCTYRVVFSTYEEALAMFVQMGGVA